MPLFVETLIAYVLPVLFYYVGVLVRYYARFLNERDPPPLREQLVAAIVFSVVAVAPLLPAIQLAMAAPKGQKMTAYVLVILVIMQEGLIMHEKATGAVRELLQRET